MHTLQCSGQGLRKTLTQCRAQREWFNAGYIFPEGFASRVQFRSSVALGSACAHECAVVGPGGAFWPAPTFTVTAGDRPLEPLVAKSCTGCWSAVSSSCRSAHHTVECGSDPLPAGYIAMVDASQCRLAVSKEAEGRLDHGHCRRSQCQFPTV